MANIPYPNQYDDELMNIFKQIIDVLNSKGEALIEESVVQQWIADNNFKNEPSVQRFQDLPANPSKNELRGVLSENAIYAYNGAEWVKMLSVDLTDVESTKQELLSAKGNYSTLKERLDAENDSITQKITDLESLPSSPPPSKIGAMTNNYKIARKTSADQLEVFQKTTLGYLRYELNQNNGGNGTSDYGGNHELLRINKVESFSDILLFKDVSTPDSGTIGPSIVSGHYNSTIKQYLEDVPQTPDTIISSSSNYPGAYQIPSNSEVGYILNNHTNVQKVKIMFFFRFNETDNSMIEIYDGANKIDEFRPYRDTRSLSERSQPLYTREVTVPHTDSPRELLDLRIKNTSSSAKVHLVAINPVKLEDYNGEDVSDFIAYGNDKPPFISAQGASDYAFYEDSTSKNFGSYHGGEVALSKELSWGDSADYDDATVKSFATVPTGEWNITKNMTIRQVTSLISKAKMYSYFNFDVDGTVKMDFSYNVNDGEEIILRNFWSALTCTGPAFQLLQYPIEKDLGVTPDDNHHYFHDNIGRVVQSTIDKKMELHTRHTKFINEHVYTESPSSISNNSIYRKQYYAPIRGAVGIAYNVKSLQFSKELDFIVNE